MNKRHYEHTLPNIRGSLSNTYGGKDVDSVIVVSRYLTKYQKIIKSGEKYFGW